jgi:hypothetical protein
MPVIPKDPPIPLWVLASVPKSPAARNPAGYRRIVFGNALTAGLFAAVSVGFAAWGSPPDVRTGASLCFAAMAAGPAFRAARAVAAWRWLDRRGDWAVVAGLAWAEWDDELPWQWVGGGVAVVVVLLVALAVMLTRP